MQYTNKVLLRNDLGNRKWFRTGANETHCRPFDASAELHQTEYNEFDQYSLWNGTLTNSFLVGMESHHDNGKEDRKYRYFYQNSENWVLSKCEWVTTNDDYDDDVDYKVLSDQVIAGNSRDIHIECSKQFK